MEAVYYAIFSHSGGYNYLNRRVCSQFRQIAPSTKVFVYWDQLLKDAIQIDGFKPSEEIVQIALEKKLFHLLKACISFVPELICNTAAEGGDLEFLQGARANRFTWDEGVCTRAAQKGHLHILRWAREHGWFYRLAIKFYIRLRLI